MSEYPEYPALADALARAEKAEKETLSAIQKSIGKWGDATFPGHYSDDGYPLLAGPFNHLVDRKKGEIWELQKAIKEEDIDRMGVEMADCIILLCTLAHMADIDLAQEIDKKMAINRTRQWGPPDRNGVCTHLAESTAEAK